MALDPEFIDDCPYGPGGLLLDEILEVDSQRGYVKAKMPTHAELPITREQKTHPLFHPSHVSGGLMVHMTGILGFAHAYYVLGLRHKAGWIGYGAKINSARFKKLASPGKDMILEATSTQVRSSPERIMARYKIVFTQDGETVYEGDQTAMWFLIKQSARLEGGEVHVTSN